MKRKPRVGSAFAASSMAWGMVRNGMGGACRLLPERCGRTNAGDGRRLRRFQSAGLLFDTTSPARATIVPMPLIETEEAARRLARAIASDLSLYNEDKIVSGIQNDNLFESLAEEIEEGRALYKRRVSPELYPQQLLRSRARRHPHQGKGAHQVEALVNGEGDSRPGRRRARPREARRLDRFLAEALAVSRSELQRWIADGRVTVDGKARDGIGARVREGERVDVDPQPPASTERCRTRGVAFDVLYVDDDVVVVNKPADWSCTRRAGTRAGRSSTGCWRSGSSARRARRHRRADNAAGDRASARQGDERRHGRRADAGGARASSRRSSRRTRSSARTRRSSSARRRSRRIDTLHGRHPRDRLRFTTRVRERQARRDPCAGDRAASTARRTSPARSRPDAPTRSACISPSRGRRCWGTPSTASPRGTFASGRWANASATRRCTPALLGFLHPTTDKLLRFEVEPPADFFEAMRALKALEGM